MKPGTDAHDTAWRQGVVAAVIGFDPGSSEPVRGTSRLPGMPTMPRTLSLAAVALLAVACSSPAASPSGPQGSPPPSGQPSASPTADADRIVHPTGATDVVLRYGEEGGFVMASYAATRVPIFTLYGDGTIVFQPLSEELPAPLANGATPGVPLRIAKLDDAQMQELLLFALQDGGLAGARATYNNDMVADAGTAVFDLAAGGLTKKVSVYALGTDLPDGQAADAPARAAFMRLAERLRDFDRGGSVPTDVYAPSAYRGILFEAGGVPGVAPIAWPWDDLKLTDFVAPPAGGFPSHALSPAQVKAVGVPDELAPGGIRDLYVSAADGKLYSFAVRPLLPDEDA